MIFQLRSYTINRGMMDQWVKYFNDVIVPMHDKHGIKIDGQWVNQDRNLFIWIRSYADPEDVKAREAAFYGSQEWNTEVDRARSHLARVVVETMEPVS